MKLPTLKPIPVAAIAAILGLAAGCGWTWLNASRVVAQAVGVRHQAESERVEKNRQRRAQGWDFWTIEIENLVSELSGEKARLHKLANDLDQRSARMAAERKELERIRLDVESIRREIDDQVIAIRSDEAKNLHGLAQTYTSLTPHAAVTILREMDDTTAVKILSLMKPDAVGPIFEDMAKTSAPDHILAHRAATLSDKLRLMKSGTLPPTAAAGP